MFRSTQLVACGLILLLACSPEERIKIARLNPERLIRNPAFTQAISVEGPHRTVYVGGQNAVDAEGNIVGKGDIAQQSETASRNLTVALEAAGATLDHVVKMNVYVVQGQNARAGFEGSRRVWGDTPRPPTVSVIYVASLAHPDFLVEFDAIAVVPLDSK